MLRRHGVKEYSVFYSPASIVWLYMLLALAAGGYVLLLPFKNYLWFAIGVATMACVLFYWAFSWLCNSFALTNEKLYIIKVSFLSKRFTAIKYSDIEWAEFGRSRGGNYVEIYSNQKSKRYYCFGLEVDSIDENFTEKCFDDLFAELKEKSVKCVDKFSEKL